MGSLLFINISEFYYLIFEMSVGFLMSVDALGYLNKQLESKSGIT